MEIIIVWLLFGFVAAIIASSRGRSGCAWFILGILLGPFGLIVALLPSSQAKQKEEAQQIGQSGDYRKCPYCAESIRKEAVKCRYCGSEVTPVH